MNAVDQQRDILLAVADQIGVEINLPSRVKIEWNSLDCTSDVFVFAWLVLQETDSLFRTNFEALQRRLAGLNLIHWNILEDESLLNEDSICLFCHTDLFDLFYITELL